MATFRGYPACSCLIEWLPAFEAELQRRGILKGSLRIYQLIGGSPKSGGTHSTGGAFDILDLPGGADLEIARQMGADATWSRPYNWDNRKGMAHMHGVLTGCPHLSWQAKAQQVAVKAVRNGLANLGRDTGPRPLSKRTWQQGIAWAKALQKPTTNLRFAQFNLPAGDKLPNTAARIKAGVALVQDCALIGWNELEGIKKANVASDFAWDLDHALGDKFLMVKPTRTLNENYISYDRDLLTLVEQYDDSILEAATGGRHITRAVFKVKATGFVFAVGQTHLVNGDTAAHERDRQTQGADALKSMLAVTAKHGNCPVIIQGDMNTAHDLKALVGHGMKKTRKWADESSTRDATTYTNYSKTAPSTNAADWIIDTQYVSKEFYCVGYSVRRKLSLLTRKYKTPRPSDHEAVVSSVRITS